MDFKYDVIVIGAGHAGCEAAAAAANLGSKTCLITMDMNKIGQMSCNPAIGGIAKGQIVREIDALGGQMGIVTDKTAIQFRMLNIGKGPAVWSPRAQCDRGKFIWEWRTTLDHTDNLDIWQDQADELLVANGEAIGVKTIWGAEFYAKSIIITAGTFLNGLMHVGRKMVEGGRCAEPAVHNFTESITRWGITTARMKTGTPVRIDKRSVHFEDMEEQPGDSDFHQFSYMGEHRVLKQLPCWTCYTNKKVHETLKSGVRMDSFAGRGFRFITSSEWGSSPSAIAGSESVSRLINNRWIGANGTGSPAREQNSTAMIPARLPDSRNRIAFLMFS